MAQVGGQPIFILDKDVLRQTGKDAQTNNISACKAVADAVRTTLGPKGMDKMMVDSIGDVVVTNDGVTILDEMEVEHPAAKMMVEVAKTQDEEVGDGTTTAVILSGELLKKAEGLLEQNIHPTIISSGYRLAKEKTLQILNEIGTPVKFEDDSSLVNVAITAMTGKNAETAKNYLAQIAVKAVKQVAEKTENGYEFDLDNIKLEKKQGGATEDTELINGIVIDKEKVHPNMPNRIKDAKIALLNVPIEIKDTETDAQIQITDPSKLQSFLEQEEKTLKEMVEKIVSSGANVVLCQKGIDDIAQHYLAKYGVLAVRRIKNSDMDKLAKATGGTVLTSLAEPISKESLGYAGIVEQKKISGDNMVFVRNCKNAKAVTILIRGGTEHVVDEIERAMEDAVGGVISALRLGMVVGGGGAVEIELARRLRAFAESVGGREQLAINAFADALEIVPRTLAENAGLDPIDLLVDLRSKHESGMLWAGINVFSGKTEDLFNKGVIEPLQIKKQAIQSSSEAAELILRIDDIISASGFKKGSETQSPAGMPPEY